MKPAEVGEIRRIPVSCGHRWSCPKCAGSHWQPEMVMLAQWFKFKLGHGGVTVVLRPGGHGHGRTNHSASGH
eukprot:1800710-Rhodomonas_salina.2